MSSDRYMSRGGSLPPLKSGIVPEDAVALAARIDGSVSPGALFAEAVWFLKPCASQAFVKHESDEVIAFMGGDRENPEALGAEVELQLENDTLTLTHTCAVFIPGGTAHGRMAVKNVTRPFFCYRFHPTATALAAVPAAATAAPGTYSARTNVVERYERVDGTVPYMPCPGLLKLLLWLDGAKLPGAPYFESVWLCRAKPGDENGAMDTPHTHEFDELLGCVGSDPLHPEDLGGEVRFMVGGEELVTDRSFLICIPRGVVHCPLCIPRMSRTMLHFTGGPAADYGRGKAGTD